MKDWLSEIASGRLPALKKGAHANPRDGLCAMELVAYIERLPHSDAPPCTCPVIAAYVRSGNDRMDDTTRQRLLPYLPRLVGTVSPAHEQGRAEALAWAALTVFAPLALEVAGLSAYANGLRSIDRGAGLAEAAWAAAAAAEAAEAAAKAGQWDHYFAALDEVLAIGPSAGTFSHPVASLDHSWGAA